MQLSKTILVSILSLASIATAQFDDGDFAIAAREADPFAGAFAEAVADPHPLALPPRTRVRGRSAKATRVRGRSAPVSITPLPYPEPRMPAA